MNVRVVMPSSQVPLQIALLLLVAIGPTSCQSKQEDAPKPPPPATTVSNEPGIIELPDGSPTLTHLQTDRAALGRHRRRQRRAESCRWRRAA